MHRFKGAMQGLVSTKKLFLLLVNKGESEQIPGILRRNIAGEEGRATKTPEDLKLIEAYKLVAGELGIEIEPEKEGPAR